MQTRGVIVACALTHHEDQSHILRRRPLQRVFILPVRRVERCLLRSRLLSLLHKDIVDQAVDEVGGDGCVRAAPEHDARRGDDGEVVQHGRRVVGLVSGVSAGVSRLHVAHFWRVVVEGGEVGVPV